jgi:hypothetical protein
VGARAERSAPEKKPKSRFRKKDLEAALELDESDDELVVDPKGGKWAHARTNPDLFLTAYGRRQKRRAAGSRLLQAPKEPVQVPPPIIDSASRCRVTGCTASADCIAVAVLGLQRTEFLLCDHHDDELRAKPYWARHWQNVVNLTYTQRRIPMARRDTYGDWEFLGQRPGEEL